jgi:AcrR family transcriptional regulator
MMTQPQATPTRERLQKALLALIEERGYEGLTIQDIVGRAKLGRTTFYLHYHSKDALFLACHEAIVNQFQVWPHTAHTQDELLAPEPPPGAEAAYRHLAEARATLLPILRGKDGLILLRRLRERSAQEIENSVRTAFAQAGGDFPLSVLANYLAGAQVALLQWWLEQRPPLAPEVLARTFHRLQRAAIREAFGMLGRR